MHGSVHNEQKQLLRAVLLCVIIYFEYTSNAGISLPTTKPRLRILVSFRVVETTNNKLYLRTTWNLSQLRRAKFLWTNLHSANFLRLCVWVYWPIFSARNTLFKDWHASIQVLRYVEKSWLLEFYVLNRHKLYKLTSSVWTYINQFQITWQLNGQ